MSCFTNEICYIGETKYKAGIFISLEAAQSKKYFDQLIMEAYPSLEAAKNTFTEKYANVLGGGEIKLNYLYQIREAPQYSVFETSFCVGITHTKGYKDSLKRIFTKPVRSVHWTHGLSYESAVDKVYSILAMKRGEPKGLITDTVHLNCPCFYKEY
ncbi:MAG: hypothetical protein Q4F41_09930 [Eubacteriales bacterium]|nr:hypothetical protein [Eubacteriales bacterium]